jgi:hypothetical protein
MTNQTYKSDKILILANEYLLKANNFSKLAVNPVTKVNDILMNPVGESMGGKAFLVLPVAGMFMEDVILVNWADLTGRLNQIINGLENFGKNYSGTDFLNSIATKFNLNGKWEDWVKEYNSKFGEFITACEQLRDFASNLEAHKHDSTEVLLKAFKFFNNAYENFRKLQGGVIAALDEGTGFFGHLWSMPGTFGLGIWKYVDPPNQVKDGIAEVNKKLELYLPKLQKENIYKPIFDLMQKGDEELANLAKVIEESKVNKPAAEHAKKPDTLEESQSATPTDKNYPKIDGKIQSMLGADVDTKWGPETQTKLDLYKTSVGKKDMTNEDVIAELGRSPNFSSGTPLQLNDKGLYVVSDAGAATPAAADTSSSTVASFRDIKF